MGRGVNSYLLVYMKKIASIWSDGTAGKMNLEKGFESWKKINSAVTGL
jgi:hypothetical protein